MQQVEKRGWKVVEFGKSVGAKVAGGAGALVASAGAMAQSTSPGAAISGELAAGKTEVMLVIAAVAVILGVLILWAYIKRAR